MERSFFPMRRSFDAYLEQTGRARSCRVDALFDVMVGALFTRALNYGAEGAGEFARSVAHVVTAALQPTKGA